MRDDDFEWDGAKAAANLARHGVSFEAARLAFSDVFAVAREDPRLDYGEDRSNNLLLHVAYTIRHERVRIISARLAEPRERRRYHEQDS
jgi:uncharacterized protein